MTEKVKKVLTIAGSDCSGGAGIQADLKTMAAFGIYGMSVITALTAQNTTGVYGVYDVTADFVSTQIDAVFSDISPDAVKIGMVSNAALVETIAYKLKEYSVSNVVLDPVMVATSGARLLAEDAQLKLMQCLLPLADIITPNLSEAEVMCGFKVATKEDMQRAAEKLSNNSGCSVLLKGGHLKDCADDLLCMADGSACWFETEHIDNPNTHGTGCTLSSAIACGLASGKSLQLSVKEAKEYVTGAISARMNLGNGSGPLNHCWMHCKTTKMGYIKDNA